MSASPLFPVTIPVLETERLLLRGHRIGDFADCLALWTDPEVTRFIGGKPSSQEEVWGEWCAMSGIGPCSVSAIGP